MIEQQSLDSKLALPASLLRRTYERVGGSLAYVFTGRSRESKSLMAFSPLGKLTCVCHAEGGRDVQKDRRGSCRACGHQVVEAVTSEWSRELSKAEIRMMVKSLERAVARGEGCALVEMEPSMDELAQYLDA